MASSFIWGYFCLFILKYVYEAELSRISSSPYQRSLGFNATYSAHQSCWVSFSFFLPCKSKIKRKDWKSLIVFRPELLEWMYFQNKKNYSHSHFNMEENVLSTNGENMKIVISSFSIAFSIVIFALIERLIHALFSTIWHIIFGFQQPDEEGKYFRKTFFYRLSFWACLLVYRQQ